jgi:6-phosphogluconolactonase
VKVEIHTTGSAVAREAARLMASEAQRAVADRGRFVVALSGGRTPWLMLRALAARDDVPWGRFHVVQVDERVAPSGHPDRNLTHLRDSLISAVPLPPEHVHAMPVESGDLAAAAERYAATLQEFAGAPAVLDLVHLGLGPDGHTASLIPGDPVLDITDRDVAVSGAYQGRPRMTLTFPIINRARRLLWVVTGREKAPALARMRDGDPTIPAGRVRHDHAVAVADRAAASQLRAA